MFWRLLGSPLAVACAPTFTKTRSRVGDGDDAASRSGPLYPTSLWVIGSLDVTLKILRIEIDLTQRAIGVAHSLIVKVDRLWMAALAAAGDRSSRHFVAEFDDSDKTVTAGAVILGGSGVSSCIE